MGNGTGGEIFAKTAKTPPLQSGVGGDIIAIQIRPLPRPWRPANFITTRHAASLRTPWNG